MWSEVEKYEYEVFVRGLFLVLNYYSREYIMVAGFSVSHGWTQRWHCFVSLKEIGFLWGGGRSHPSLRAGEEETGKWWKGVAWSGLTHPQGRARRGRKVEWARCEVLQWLRPTVLFCPRETWTSRRNIYWPLPMCHTQKGAKKKEKKKENVHKWQWYFQCHICCSNSTD